MGAVEVVAERAPWRRLAPRCVRVLRGLARATGRSRASVTLLLASDPAVRRLNRSWRGQDRPTDVLSFPAAGDLEPGRAHLGDLAIAVPTARRQAKRAGWSFEEELDLLVTHGFLHLLGYDHETDDGTMRRLEERLLARVAGVRLHNRRRPWGEASRRAARRTAK